VYENIVVYKFYVSKCVFSNSVHGKGLRMGTFWWMVLH
jgi:hypothetical protein